jgi:hypothetical protein
MRFFKAFLVSLGLLFATSSGASAALIGLSSFLASVPSDTSSLWSINPATGAATLITPVTPVTDVPSFVGLGVLGGTLYASDVFTSLIGGKSGGFVSLNPATGAVSVR